MFFILHLAHADPVFAQIGSKNNSFYRLITTFFFSDLLDYNLNYCNWSNRLTFHGKYARKRSGFSVTGQTRSNILEKKNEETDNRLFSYFACVWEIHLKPIHNGYRNTWVEI